LSLAAVAVVMAAQVVAVAQGVFVLVICLLRLVLL